MRKLIQNFVVQSNERMCRKIGCLGLDQVFCILRNIPTIVGITCRGHGCEYGIYVQLILIDKHIGNTFYCGGGVKLNIYSK